MAIDLATITAGDGSQGFVLQGEQAGDQSGWSVASAGDVNGDGFDDLIVGAPYADGPADGRSGAGDSYVVFGKAGGFAPTLDLAAITAGDGSQGFVLQGERAGDQSGFSVASGGDVNGDGFDDLIVGARFADGPADGRSVAGDSYVVFGKAGGFAPTIDLATITAGDGSKGFVLQGEQAGIRSGSSVASAGDIDGDGFDDLIVGAYYAGPTDDRSAAGDSYVVFGKAGGFAPTIDLATITSGDGSQGFVLQGEQAGDRSGLPVASAGDVNGDGFDDLIVGAKYADGPADGLDAAGDSYVVFGKAGGFAPTDLATITAGDGSQGFVLQGEQAYDRSGSSVASAGDINGDGFDDLIVGAKYADGPADGRDAAGDSYVVFGKAGGFAAALDLAAITSGDGSQGFVLQGEQFNDRSGFSVASAGDVNGDGFDDLIVGAYAADGPADGRDAAGDSYVVFGKAGGFAATIDLATITAGDGSQGFVLQGEQTNDVSGWSVASAGDVNGDGFDDLMVGARGGDGPADGRIDAGDSYVIFGSATVGGSASHLTQTAGGNGNDFLAGSAGVADVLVGGRGDDTISGAGGTDSLRGGEGNDILGIGDAAFARLDGGNGLDTLSLTGAMTLVDSDFRRVSDMEGITLADQAVNLTLGRIASKAFEGLAATGFSVTIDAAASVSTAQTINAAAFNHSLVADFSSNTLGVTVGGGLRSDQLTGGSGNDTLNGGGGADTLTGLGGNDTYFVDNAADVVVEGAGQGTLDFVATRVSYALGTGVQVEKFTTTSSGGTAAINLTGNEFAQAITGNAGDNRIDGKGGADTMTGLGGNDTYFVDNAADVVVEGAGQGTLDFIATRVSYALGAGVQVEKFTTTSNSGTTTISLTGNEFVQAIIGNAAANTINGKAGADTMTGLGGNDTYFVDNAGDKVVEGTGQGTLDFIATNVSYVLGAGVQVEKLATTSSGGTAAINLAGNEFGQLIIGNAGANIINGKAGLDTLTGLGGADAFVFDRASGAANYDHITDFVHGQDKIRLDHDIFATLPTGALASTAFKDISSAAEDANDRILYKHANGALYYDADGAGGAGPQLIAILDNHPAIVTSADFLIIA